MRATIYPPALPYLFPLSLVLLFLAAPWPLHIASAQQMRYFLRYSETFPPPRVASWRTFCPYDGSIIGRAENFVNG
ncbi:hypothetical protein QBC40DRAFT_275121 [Triangularia verruculosa]|uniref:Uncharacterized protein n=1 Tax=Triangularia verruculosa TaxID=2587418 RepID=A0AAN6XP40_9PEZI|nr:hypothetical protein QBC40DRAFT_275121 [Triangularia verruculosa]